MKKITIYSTPSCHYCNLAKEFFDEHGIKYQSFDVASDLEKRKEMMEKSGQLGVPVIFVDDEMIIGFDRSRLVQLLDIG